MKIKYLTLVVLLEKHIITLKLQKLKIKLVIIIIANILQRLAQANLITKTDFDPKLSSLNRKVTKNKTENLLAEKELNQLKTFDSSYFIGKSHFEEDDTKNCLVFSEPSTFILHCGDFPLFSIF